MKEMYEKGHAGENEMDRGMHIRKMDGVGDGT
jgi:hypothetical protein